MNYFYVIVLFSLLSCTQETVVKRVLPIVGNADVEYRTVNGKEVADTIFPKIPAFSYLNHDSVVIHSKDMKNKVWIADFFFTSCPTICPTMTAQMKRLNVKTADLSEHVQFLSFSINPKMDKPHVLRAYRQRHGVEAANWHFFTGDEAATHRLGTEHFHIFAHEDIESEGGYAHSPAFVLIDKSGYVRGVYVGTETKEVDRLEQDLRKLLKYEYATEGKSR